MSTPRFQVPRRRLMGPGPSDVPRRVLDAMAQPAIGHLDPAFVGMMDELKDLLRHAFRTRNDTTFCISGPGSAGMEACVHNLVEPGDRVVVCINGVFGGRLRDLVGRAGGEAIVVERPWGEPIEPDDVRPALADGPVKAVAFVHAETSTGVRSDAAGIAAVARQAGALVIADTVTSLGGIPLEVDEWGLDAVYSGSQKCLSCPPGLSPVTFSPRAVAAVEARREPVRSWLFDIGLLTGYWGGGKRVYHHTAPVNALYGLHEALAMLEEEGLERAWARHRHMHEALAAGLQALGLEMPVDPDHRLPQLNLVGIPEGVDDAAARSALLDEHGIEIGAGLGDFAGRAWRIGLMGQSASPDHVLACLAALEAVLERDGGVAAAGGRIGVGRRR